MSIQLTLSNQQLRDLGFYTEQQSLTIEGPRFELDERIGSIVEAVLDYLTCQKNWESLYTLCKKDNRQADIEKITTTFKRLASSLRNMKAFCYEGIFLKLSTGNFNPQFDQAYEECRLISYSSIKDVIYVTRTKEELRKLDFDPAEKILTIKAPKHLIDSVEKIENIFNTYLEYAIARKTWEESVYLKDYDKDMSKAKRTFVRYEAALIRMFYLYHQGITIFTPKGSPKLSLDTIHEEYSKVMRRFEVSQEVFQLNDFLKELEQSQSNEE